ncbi:hypothetical protein GCM10022421_26700 [Oceanisphaera sediminis]|uniref:Uncharacterized protein n=1 Tax=Oceanisphaera sediminis TaxID=981381 RepID=A0ABP7EI01_9GAMM
MQINTAVSYKPEENGTGDWGLGTGDWGLGTGDWGYSSQPTQLKEGKGDHRADCDMPGMACPSPHGGARGVSAL